MLRAYDRSNLDIVNDMANGSDTLRNTYRPILICSFVLSAKALIPPRSRTIRWKPETCALAAVSSHQIPLSSARPITTAIVESVRFKVESERRLFKAVMVPFIYEYVNLDGGARLTKSSMADMPRSTDSRYAESWNSHSNQVKRLASE